MLRGLKWFFLNAVDFLIYMECDCHMFLKYLVVQMNNLVFQSKYLVFRSKTLDFD